MSYLITQIIFCLLIAFLIGFAVGWLFRNLAVSARLKAQENEWRVRTRSLQDERDRSQALADELNARVNTLSSELSGASKSVEQLNEQLRQSEETVSTREASVSDLEEKIRSLDSDVEQGKTRIGGLDADLSRQGTRVTDMEAALAQRDTELSHKDETIDSLRSSLGVWESKLPPLHQGIEDRDQQITILQAELQARDEAFSKLQDEAQARLRTEPGQHSDVGDRSQLERRLAERDRDIASRDKRIRGLEIDLQKCRESARSGSKPARAQPHEPDAPSFRIKAAPGEKDDLKRIHGIGPVLERMLNDLGIFLFDQIAAFTSEDIQWVTDHIDAFPDRIVRDKWVEQAAKFAAQKS